MDLPPMSAGQKLTASCLLIVSGLIAVNVSAWPQYLEAGRTEFLSNCTACHGANGKGTGPLSATLKTKPADLTALAKRNNGVFSPDAVYKMIDGREAIRTHRSIEMPIWGCRHKGPAVSLRKFSGRHHATPPVGESNRAPPMESFLDFSCDPEPIIRDRILAIVRYLSHIQEK